MNDACAFGASKRLWIGLLCFCLLAHSWRFVLDLYMLA